MTDWTLIVDPMRDDYYQGEYGVLLKDGAEVWSGYTARLVEETLEVVLGEGGYTVKERPHELRDHGTYRAHE